MNYQFFFKSISISLFIIFFSFKNVLLAQKQKGSDRKKYFELNDRASFFHFDERYQLASDTIYYSTPGFLVFSHYDSVRINKENFLIFTYPGFSKGKQNNLIFKGKNLSLDGVADNGYRRSIIGVNDRILAIKEKDFNKIKKTEIYDISFTKGKNTWDCFSWLGYLRPNFVNYNITTGILTVPFKLRPSSDSSNFSLSTDVTIGPYIGITKRISSRRPIYITIPFTAGLTFINIQNNSTQINQQENMIDLVSGVSWSTGLIIQLDNFDFGFVLGRDYASGLGNSWKYHNKTWYSFAIGYSFMKEKDD